MKRLLLLLSASLYMTPSAFAAEDDTNRGLSVFDANPRCMERNVDPADPACIVKGVGVPRQTYPPAIVNPLPTTPVLPNAPVAPSVPPTAQEGNRAASPVAQDGANSGSGAPAAREANRGSGRPGG